MKKNSRMQSNDRCSSRIKMMSKSRSDEPVSATSQNQLTNEANDLLSNEEQKIVDPLTADPLESKQGILVKEEQSNDRCSSKRKMTPNSRSDQSVSTTSRNQQTNEANDLSSNKEQDIADPLTAEFPLESEQDTLVKEEEQSNDRCSSKIKKTESSNLRSAESVSATSQDQQTDEANDLPSDEEQDIVEPLTPVPLESDKEALVKDEESDKDSDTSKTDSQEKLKKDCLTFCQELGCHRCFGRYTVYIAACCAFSVHLVSVNIGTFLGKYVATVITNICCCIYCQNWCCPGLSE